jgi:SAM-dependent methyltransferase
VTFAHLYANEYDALYASKSYSGECDLIEATCKRFDLEPSSVLDVGCGTGSHIIELASRGYKCVGIDLSPAMLAIAANKAEQAGLSGDVSFFEGDAREFLVEGPFDLITMMFAVASYLTTNDEIISALKNIRKHLRPGGLFVCDFWYGPAVLSLRPDERIRVIEAGEKKTLRAASTAVDSFNHTADVTFRLWNVEGSAFLGETTEVHRMRYFFPQEFQALLAQCGFEFLLLSEFPSLDVQLTDQSWNAFCVARAV